MKALVVVESWFGNTRALADAIADGLSSRMVTEVVDVDRAPAVLPPDVDLVVIGGPTHAFGLSRPGTREAAARQAAGAGSPAASTSPARGLREWLADLPHPSGAVAGVAFDTRIKKALVPGSAARAAAKRLRRLGLEQVSKPESFWVLNSEGPLHDGEIDRAHRWAEQLSTQMAAKRPMEHQ
jgi:flavodoxin